MAIMAGSVSRRDASSRPLASAARNSRLSFAPTPGSGMQERPLASMTQPSESTRGGSIRRAEIRRKPCMTAGSLATASSLDEPKSWSSSRVHGLSRCPGPSQQQNDRPHCGTDQVIQRGPVVSLRAPRTACSIDPARSSMRALRRASWPNRGKARIARKPTHATPRMACFIAVLLLVEDLEHELRGELRVHMRELPHRFPAQPRVLLVPGDLDQGLGIALQEEPLQDLPFHRRALLGAVERDQEGARPLLAHEAEMLERLAPALGVLLGPRQLDEPVCVAPYEERVDQGTLGGNGRLGLVQGPELVLCPHHAQLLDGLTPQLGARLALGRGQDPALVTGEHEAAQDGLLQLDVGRGSVDFAQGLAALGAAEEAQVLDGFALQVGALLAAGGAHHHLAGPRRAALAEDEEGPLAQLR